MITPQALMDVLLALPVAVDEVRCSVRGVPVSAYPGGERPSGVLEIRGAGERGCGECVAWSLDAQARHGALLSSLIAPGPTRVGDLVRALGDADPYARAAAEGAAIDLALRQAKLSIAALSGVGAVDLACAISFDACPDPAGRMAALLSEHPEARFKVDVDPAWDDQTIAALANHDRIAIVDFKHRGDASFIARIAAALPLALLEDPPSTDEALSGRFSRDATVHSADDITDASTGGAINIKAPRMGGFCEALRGIARAKRVGARVYLGGMFEVGIGRRQARVLAALYAPAEPNDLAPILDDERRGWPGGKVRVDLRRPGFGG